MHSEHFKKRKGAHAVGRENGREDWEGVGGQENSGRFGQNTLLACMSFSIKQKAA